MRADPVLAFCEIAVHAKHLKARWVIIALHPKIEFYPRPANFLLLFIASAVDVVDRQKFIDHNSAALTLWTAICIERIAPDSHVIFLTALGLAWNATFTECESFSRRSTFATVAMSRKLLIIRHINLANNFDPHPRAALGT